MHSVSIAYFYPNPIDLVSKTAMRSIINRAIQEVACANMVSYHILKLMCQYALISQPTIWIFDHLKQNSKKDKEEIKRLNFYLKTLIEKDTSWKLSSSYHGVLFLLPVMAFKGLEGCCNRRFKSLHMSV